MENIEALKKHIDEQGKYVKNYKEMCRLLDEPEKTGKSRKLQINDWGRYFEYEKEGQKWIIKKIYDEPLPKGNSKGSCYYEYFSYIISELIEQNEGDYIATASNMAIDIGYITTYYKKFHYNKNDLLEKSDIFTKKLIDDFFEKTSRGYTGLIKRSLDKMKKAGIIDYEEVPVGYKKNDYNGYLLEGEEAKAYKEIEEKAIDDVMDACVVHRGIDKKTLDKWSQEEGWYKEWEEYWTNKYKDKNKKQELVKTNNMRMVYKLMEFRLQDKFDYVCVIKGYRIKFNPNYVYKKQMGKYFNVERKKFNSLVKEKTRKNFEKRIEKKYGKKLFTDEYKDCGTHDFLRTIISPDISKEDKTKHKAWKQLIDMTMSINKFSLHRNEHNGKCVMQIIRKDRVGIPNKINKDK